MLQLASTDKITIVTSAPSTIRAHASYLDYNSGTGAGTVGRQNTLISTATTTDIIGSPAAGSVRNIRGLSIFNSGTGIQQITVSHDDGSIVSALYSTTLLPNESVVLDANSNWHLYSNGGAMKNPVSQDFDVQSFSTPGTYWWTKPTSATFVQVFLYGGGGGGCGSVGTSVSGGTGVSTGCGGGGGAFNTCLYLARDLQTYEKVTVARGGAGGAGLATGIQPQPGDGGTSLFGTVTRIRAGGGGGGGRQLQGGGGGGTGSAGQDGYTNVSLGGLPGNFSSGTGNGQLLGTNNGSGARGLGSGGPTLAVAEYGGGGGTAVGGNTPGGGGSLFGGGGGGVGGDTTSTPRNPQNGGASNSYRGGTGGAGGTNSSTAPTAGSNGADGDGVTKGGDGGGGGGAASGAVNISGTAGGNGGWPGGGGGGAGAGLGTGVGAKGGDGGNGSVIIISW